MRIRYASLTDVGVKRSHNQDAYAAQPAADDAHWRSHGHVFIVADGMGGHAVGEKASAKAVRDIPLTYLKHVAQEGVPAAIRRAFEETNDAIYQIGLNNPEFKGLGTTGTAVVLRPEGAWIGHVGDSRAYRIRGDRIQQLTFDHSWVWEVARRQGIDPDELGDFKRNVIIRSLGPDAKVDVDIEGPYPLEPGDTFLVCSDGLTNEVTPQEIGAVVRAFPHDVASRYLVDLANIRGGKDNVTCLVATIPDEAVGLKSRRRAGLLGPLLRVVPWPFLALGLGATAATASVGFQLANLRSVAIPAFIGAAILILSGLVGLYLQLKRKAEALTETNLHPTPGELHIYRDYEFAYTPELSDRFAALSAELKTLLESTPETSADWPAHAVLTEEAGHHAAKQDWLAAFSAHFRAMHLLADTIHQARGKDDGFSPSYNR